MNTGGNAVNWCLFGEFADLWSLGGKGMLPGHEGHITENAWVTLTLRPASERQVPKTSGFEDQ